MLPTNPTLNRLNKLLEKHQLGHVNSLSPISGGCTSQCYRVSTQMNNEVFLKTQSNVPEDFFASEASNLKILDETQTLRTPQVIASSEHFLILEYIEPAIPNTHYWTHFAQGLATLHKKSQPGFGFNFDNYCGKTPQPNPLNSDGIVFFSNYRLRFQMEFAFNNGLLDDSDTIKLECLINKLPQLLPNEPASLIHGDLWSGNIFCDMTEAAVIVDPACYWGFREADIAMTRLFGHFPDSFYECYQEISPLEPGWEERMDIYNLYHLLNHLNMFGQSYIRQIRQIIKLFV